MEYTTFAETYKDLLYDCLYNYDYETSPRGYKVRELINICLVFDPTTVLYNNSVRSTKRKYLSAEMLWYLKGDRSFMFIKPFAKMWEHLASQDGEVNSNYGYLLLQEKYSEDRMTGWAWACSSLIRDKESRQAIMHINKPEHLYEGNKDVPCTMSVHYYIRDNRLFCNVEMRSNDLIYGTPVDCAWFSFLHIQMWQILKNYYTDLKIGSYTHKVTSAHLYEKHFSLVKDMLNSEFSTSPNQMPKNSLVINRFGEVNNEILCLYELVKSEKNVKDLKSKNEIAQFIIDNLSNNQMYN